MIEESIWTERMHGHVVRRDDYRTPYDVDYSRVAHSQFYRRLAGKSQILSVTGDGDYHRNRLTHTIEVGQIALGLIQFLTATEKREEVRALIPSRALMETISAVHDIGHPPYGHGGEVALNYCMLDHGGFEGNGQTLRILTRLLEGSSTRAGGNLTRNTLLGALKYPVPYSQVARAVPDDARATHAQLEKVRTIIDTISAIKGLDAVAPSSEHVEIAARIVDDGSVDSVDRIARLLTDAMHGAPRPTSLKGQPISPLTGERLLVHTIHEPPKCYLDTERDIVDWLLSPFSSSDRTAIVANRAKSLPGSLMDTADDLAYGPGDLEDAVTLGLISREMISDGEKGIPSSYWDGFLDMMCANYPHDYQDSGKTRYEVFLDQLFGCGTKEQSGRLIHYMIANSHIREREGYEEAAFRFTVDIRPEAKRLLSAIKKIVMDRVIRAPEVQQLRFKGQQMIVKLFDYYAHDPRHLLPTEVYAKYAAQDDETARMRTICDFVATMTDPGMTRAYKRLFDPSAGSVFDNLM
jgi:dGTPase